MVASPHLFQRDLETQYIRQCIRRLSQLLLYCNITNDIHPNVTYSKYYHTMNIGLNIIYLELVNSKTLKSLTLFLFFKPKKCQVSILTFRSVGYIKKGRWQNEKVH